MYLSYDSAHILIFLFHFISVIINIVQWCIHPNIITNILRTLLLVWDDIAHLLFVLVVHMSDNRLWRAHIDLEKTIFCPKGPFTNDRRVCLLKVQQSCLLSLCRLLKCCILHIKATVTTSFIPLSCHCHISTKLRISSEEVTITCYLALSFCASLSQKRVWGCLLPFLVTPSRLPYMPLKIIVCFTNYCRWELQSLAT